MRDKRRLLETGVATLSLLLCTALIASAWGSAEAAAQPASPAPATTSLPGKAGADGLCGSIHTLVEAGRKDFDAVTGEEVKSLLSYHKTTLSPEGAIEPCKILGGAIGKFVTCNMTAPLDQKTAEAAFTAQREKVQKCIPSSWTTRERSANATEKAVTFKESEKGISPAVEVHLKDRGQGRFQIQLWVQEKSL